MATFLDLTKEAAQKSRTHDPATIRQVTAAGRPGRIANLVSDAWLEIQNRHDKWRFLVVEFPVSAVLSANERAFSAASFNIANWSDWILGGRDDVALTVWPAGDDDAERDTERAPTIVEWGAFQRSYLVGDNRSRTGAPQAITVDQQDRLVVWPTPDVDYRIAGTYRRTPQILEANGDTPDGLIAEGYQDAIVWRAVELIHQVDEGDGNVLITARERAMNRMAALRRRYLPTDPKGIEWAPTGGVEPGARGVLGPYGAFNRTSPNSNFLSR